MHLWILSDGVENGGHWPWTPRSFGYCDSEFQDVQHRIAYRSRPAKGCYASQRALVYVATTKRSTKLCIFSWWDILYLHVASQVDMLVFWKQISGCPEARIAVKVTMKKGTKLLTLPVLGWGLQSQFPSFGYFHNFSVTPKHTLSVEHHVHIWQVSPQLRCADTCQLWMWLKSKQVLLQYIYIKYFAYGEINRWSFSNLHPRFHKNIGPKLGYHCTCRCPST